MANTPIYSYSDGSTVTFKTVGPKNQAVLTFGKTYNTIDGIIITKGDTQVGDPSFTVGLDVLAETQIISLNDLMDRYGFPQVTLISKNPNAFPSEQSPLITPLSSSTSTPYSDGSTTQGNFEYDYDLSDSLPPPNETIKKIKIKAPGFSPIEIPVEKLDGSIKDDLGIISLIPLSEQIEIDKIKSSQPTEEELKQQSKDREDLSYMTYKQLIKKKQTLSSKLIPLILTLGGSFGMSKLPELLDRSDIDIENIIGEDKICPSENKLFEVIKRKNNIVKQLNQVLTIIKTTNTAINVNKIILTGAQITLDAVGNIPPPYNPLPPNQLKTLERQVSTLDSINSGLLYLLTSLISIINLIIKLLSLLDKMIKDCSEDSNLDLNDTQKNISEELLSLTKKQSNDGSPLLTNVNGFKLSVETEITSNSLKRRRAIARNKDGVVMLKGEYSFSSIDQILIDELTFTIEQNNLKAD